MRDDQIMWHFRPSYRLAQFAVHTAFWVGLLYVATAEADTIRFLVGEVRPFHYDSYVLPLSDPEAIAHARRLIEFGPQVVGEYIAIASIARGTNGINRNYIAPGAPPWSWHVTSFWTFTWATPEILDGSPTAVEMYPDWINQIGFWAYTVVAELPRGDYDADLDVDLDDYIAWKSSYGSTSDLSADGNGNGSVDAADYTVWLDNFGATTKIPPHLFPPVVPDSIPVAESSNLALVVFAASIWSTANRRRRQLL